VSRAFFSLSIFAFFRLSSICEPHFLYPRGRNSILVYKQDPSSGLLELLSECQSPREGDGPRHVVPSPDGKWVFTVTEHTSYLDVFAIEKGGKLRHAQSASVVPEGEFYNRAWHSFPLVFLFSLKSRSPLFKPSRNQST